VTHPDLHAELRAPPLAVSVPELFRRQPTLAWLGVFFGLGLVPMLIAAGQDPRVLDGAEVWLKPSKFLMSLSVYAFTNAWFFGYVDEADRRGPTARWIVRTITTTSLLEMAYILLQASRGERSHFNMADPVHAALYLLMGLGALLLVGASIPLAALIARRPQPGLRPAFRDAVVIGLVLTTVLGGGFGGYMSSRMSHWVGPEPSSPGLPFFGWSTTGGDLRPPHFFGIHAEQALPVFAALVPGRGLGGRVMAWLAAAGYVAFTAWVFARSVAGEPFIAL
jgi:hypothetical protein